MEEIVLQRLKDALRLYGLSTTLLAGYLKVNPSTLISKLNGTRGLDIDTLCMILNFYPDLSTEWLFRGTEPMDFRDKRPKSLPKTEDKELRDMYIEQARMIHHLEMKIIELEEKNRKKEHA